MLSNQVHRLGRIIVALLVPFVVAGPGMTQSSVSGHSRELVQRVDSGHVANRNGAPGTVIAFHVYVEGAVWLRLYFSQIDLGGDVESGSGSVLRITSLKDGYYQTLDAASVKQWDHSSAYFNGDVVLVEVIAQPGTGDNRVVLDRVTVGMSPVPVQEAVCGSDDRTLSSDQAVARTMPRLCTNFVIDDECGCLLTAGHCAPTPGNVAEFNVPLSNPDGSLNHPPPSDQYVVDPASVQANSGGAPDDDWCYYGVFPNSTTKLTPVQAYGAFHQLAPPPTWSSVLNIRVTGYGQISSSILNQVQQTAVGEWLPYTGGTEIEFLTDATGGNSGSPLIQEESGKTIGILGGGFCMPPGVGNKGTATIHPGLQAALANPVGVCFKPSCSTQATTTFRNGSGINLPCLSSLTLPQLGTNWLLQVDTSVVPGATYSLVRSHVKSSTGPVVGFGEILLDLSSRLLFVSVVPASGGLDVHGIRVPPSTELAGFRATVQGVIADGSGLAQACNAVDFTLGCVQ